MTVLSVSGFKIHKSYLSLAQQHDLLSVLREGARDAPFFEQFTPSGKTMSVRMTAAGQFGWIAGKGGYRYAAQHPNGKRWPQIPAPAMKIWRDLTGLDRDPECCLINFYGKDARMGMHQDKDENSFDWPVVSISLGDDGLFRMRSETRGGKTQSIWLHSGDVVVMGGPARLAHHGVDRVRYGSSTLLPKGGRLNLTLRVVS